MPYRTVKRVRQSRITFHDYTDYASNFGVELDDDETWKRYPLNVEVTNQYVRIRGNVSQLLDDAGKQILPINKTFDFFIDCKYWRKSFLRRPYGRIYEERFLYLPRDLLLDFGIEEGMFIDLLLTDIVVRNGKDEIITRPIFKEILKIGSMDIELKDDKGEKIPSKAFINTEFADDFYSDLVIEINRAYSLGLYTSTLVLTRKLFENLLVDLLLARFDIKNKDERSLFYDDEKHMHHSLSVLIPNLRRKNKDFLSQAFQEEEFYKFLNEMKEDADAGAHSIEIQPDPTKIDAWKPHVNNYSNLILREIARYKKSQ